MTMHELDRSEYPRISTRLKELPINTFFARAVVEGHTGGRVFVDDPRFPNACYVAHRYGMSLLFGTVKSESFLASLQQYLLGESPRRLAAEWLQVFPDVWSEVLGSLLGENLVPIGSPEAEAELEGEAGGRVVQDVRVNFRFDPLRYARLRASTKLPVDCTIIDDVDSIYARMKGSVVPSIFWDDSAELRRRGAAFGLLHRGELASAAFASFAMDEALELGIETVERFRGRGFALHACSALIDDCLARHLEPVWACRLTNIGSYRLALKLGFDHVRSLPYYRLPVLIRAQAGAA